MSHSPQSRFVVGAIAGALAGGAILIGLARVWRDEGPPIAIGADPAGAPAAGPIRTVTDTGKVRVLQRCRGACDEIRR